MDGVPEHPTRLGDYRRLLADSERNSELALEAGRDLVAQAECPLRVEGGHFSSRTSHIWVQKRAA